MVGYCLLHEQDRVAVPCFLKDFFIPIVRAGQQLQVLKKLLELCNYVGPEEYTCEDLLPSWRGYLSNHLFSASPLTFSKGYLEAMVIARNNYYENMLEKIKNLSSKLEFRHRQVIVLWSELNFLDIFFLHSAIIDGRRLKFTISIPFLLPLYLAVCYIVKMPVCLAFGMGYCYDVN